MKPGSLELLNRKLPLQNRRFKWWEHVTREDYDCTGAEYVFWYYGDWGPGEKTEWIYGKRWISDQEKRKFKSRAEGKKMKRTLIVIDMQNDFIDGSLGTPEAQAIVRT